MSSKDNKPDLSNLKSRLGLKKSGDDSDQSSEKATQETTGSGAQTALKGSKKRSGAKKGSEGVDDRLAALKESKLKSSKKEEPSSAPEAASSHSSAPAGARRGVDDVGTGAQPGQSGAAGQGAGARRQAGPPTGAQGPPPTAMAPPPTERQQATTTTSPSGQFDLEDDEEIDLKEFDLDDGGIFSPATVVVMGVVLIVGLMFGYFASSSFDARAIQQSRVDDARSLQADLEPKIEDFDRAQEIIAELDDDDIRAIDFEAAEELAHLDFVVTSRVLPRQRMLLADQDIVGRLNHVMGATDALYRLVLEHHRVTTGADRAELEAYLEETEEWHGPNEEIAALFNLVGWANHSADDQSTPQQFNPSPGAIVRMPTRPDFDPEEEAQSDDPTSRFVVDENGMIEVEFVTPHEYGEPGSTHEAFIYDLVPIETSQFLDVDRNNAVQRYHNRISEMQEYVDSIARVLGPLEESIDEVSAEDVPLFSIGTTVDDPADHDDEDLRVDEDLAADEPAMDEEAVDEDAEE